MKIVASRSLQPLASLEWSIHALDGTELFNKGVAVSADDIDLIIEAGHTDVLLVDMTHEEVAYKTYLLQKRIPLDALSGGNKIAVKPLFNLNGEQVVAEGQKITPRLYQRLIKEQGGVYIQTKSPPKQSAATLNFLRLKDARHRESEITKRQDKSPGVMDRVELSLIIDDPKSISVSSLEDHLEEALKEQEIDSGEPLEQFVREVPPETIRSEAQKQRYTQLYQEALLLTGQVMDEITNKREFDAKRVEGLSKTIIEALVEDRNLLMTLPNNHNHLEYMKYHTINTVILSVNMATALGYSKERILEVAYGAFFHNVGMTMVPENILEKSGELTNADWFEIKKMPIYGINILQNIRGLPFSTPYVAYHCHEFQDGSGYPKGRKSTAIHRIAQIVQVASTYDALTSKRPYREANLPYKAMENLILMVSRKKFDRDILKALLRVESLFPIGSWVKLTDGQVGKVIGVNGDSYAKPILRVFYSAPDEKLPEPRVLNLLEYEDLKVDEPLISSAYEKHIMEGF